MKARFTYNQIGISFDYHDGKEWRCISLTTYKGHNFNPGRIEEAIQAIIKSYEDKAEIKLGTRQTFNDDPGMACDGWNATIKMKEVQHVNS
jgi:hypothetical protein